MSCLSPTTRRPLTVCLIGLGLMTLLARPLPAADPRQVTGGDRIALAWFNAAGFYQNVLTGLQSLSMPKGAALRAELARLVDSAAASFAQARRQANQTACAKQRRLLHSALEMYRLDHQPPLPAPGPIDLARLRAGPYLKGEVACPEGGTYSLTGPLDHGGEVACSVHGSAKAPRTDANRPPAVNLERLIGLVQEFHDKNLCRPRGGLWFGVDSLQGFGACLEADCQPLPLVEFLRTIAPVPLPAPDEQTPDKVVFRLPPPARGAPPLTLTLTSRGIFLDAFRTPGGAAPTGPWAEMVALTQAGTSDVLVELDGSLFTRTMKEQVPNPADPIRKAVQSLARIRIVVGRGGCRAMATFADPQAVTTLQPPLEQQLGIIKPLLDKGLYDQLQAMPPEAKAGIDPLRNMVASLAVFTDGPWLGIAAPELPAHSALLLPAVTGVIVANAIPNYARAREQARASQCRANMRVIMGALEMDELDTGKRPARLDFQDLLGKKLLREIPVCPEGGVYSAEPDASGQGFRINCTVHGPLPD
ncbi:MAG: hypothetical protein OZSIB_0477 [Candidatus Ozemobacter sibiricus]|jgi:type II secretory pathway pseudopilin PulG|uniref:Uncharacterized protein n=1 Tax=Candidatus Ozemobacter sibiricus TaxID=2268124 RepID=A0A367ZLF0_9BACT|nr:MAG: hypothetical protein OZSIB_0477 [Candidatus Ozemobacter sibiricus]